jgi:RNA polymerase sigma-70 factor (ECF subfamily)
MAISNCLCGNPNLWVDWFMAEVVGRAVNSLSGSEKRSDVAAPEHPEAQAVSDLEDSRKSRQGDGEAFGRIVERHQDRIAKIMWRFSRDSQVHEELVQDVFVEAYLSLRTYRAKAPFAHWLARIATRVGYRYWKQTARREATRAFSLEEWDQLQDETGEQLDPGRAAALLYRLLEQLPPRDRLVLTLRYLDECDVADTALRTGWTKSMVKVQTLRAKKKLEKLFRTSGKEFIS